MSDLKHLPAVAYTDSDKVSYAVTNLAAQSQCTGRRFFRLVLAIFCGYAAWNALQSFAEDPARLGDDDFRADRFGLVAPDVLPVDAHTDLCPQVEPLHPSAHADLDATLMALYATEEFQTKAFGKLSGAIQIPYVFAGFMLWHVGSLRTMRSTLALAPSLMMT